MNNYTHPKREELLEIFNITQKQSILHKLRHLKAQRERYANEVARLTSVKIKAKKHEKWLPEMFLISRRNQENKFEKAIYYQKKRLSLENEKAHAKKHNLPPPQPSFTEHDLEHIKKHTPIEQLMGDPVKTAMGGKKWYCCPFHNEKTPSFLWNDAEEDKYFKCYGCGQGGDILTLHQHINGTTFHETLKLLV